MRRLSNLARQAVQQYGGTLLPVVGDRCLALFGAVAQEDHAQRAALATLALHQQVAAQQEAFPGATAAGGPLGIGMQKPPSSTRARCSRRSTRKSTAPSAASLRRAGRRLRFRPSSAGHGLAREDLATWRRRRTRRSSPRRTPSLLDMASFTEIGVPRDLAKIFESAELIHWRSFRESEDSRYVSLVLPRVLLRLPYGPKTVPGGRRELRRGRRRHRPPRSTCGAIRRYGARPSASPPRSPSTAGPRRSAASRAAARSRACRPIPSSPTRATSRSKCPTEIAITDRREKELQRSGLHRPVSTARTPTTRVLRWPDGQQGPRLYDTNAANANARISAMLPYVLNASRFAHYVKVIMRDKVGSFMTSGERAAVLEHVDPTTTCWARTMPASR